MAYTKIPEKDAVLLIRALGLLISQSSIYGPTHKVTQNAARSVFAELEETVKTYGTVEIVLNERQLLVNGSPDGIDSTIGKNLIDRLTLHKIGGLAFQEPALIDEFLTCITLLGTLAPTLEATGGFDAAFKRAELKHIQLITVAFQRISGEAQEVETLSGVGPHAPSVPDSPLRRARPSAGGFGVLDLSAALESEAENQIPESRNSDETKRKEQTVFLAKLLRETATLLEQKDGQTMDSRHQAVMDVMSQIQHLMEVMTDDSKQHITALADQVDDDQQTIASIESAARRRGIGLKLTRVELVQRYAELNQEIVQPLTVSTGVIGMLKAECAGTLNVSQHELLQMAEESVERVNQLVAYMSRISGLPESYTPDSKILRDTYR